MTWEPPEARDSEEPPARKEVREKFSVLLIDKPGALKSTFFEETPLTEEETYFRDEAGQQDFSLRLEGGHLICSGRIGFQVKAGGKLVPYEVKEQILEFERLWVCGAECTHGIKVAKSREGRGKNYRVSVHLQEAYDFWVVKSQTGGESA